MGKEVPSQDGKAEMIKKALSLLLALLLVTACAGVSAFGAFGGAGVFEEPPTEPTTPPSDPTPAPTQVPTEEPIPPTDPPVIVTEPPQDPTDPPVDPTNPPVNPTDPPSDPTPTPKPRLEITTASHLPHTVVGSSYSMRLEANYSDAVFSDPSGGFASIGLTLSSSGAITGRSTRSGNFSVNVTAVSASAGESVQKKFTIHVYEPGETTPAPTNTPAPTEPPTDPSAEPTAFPVDPNGRLWSSASDTLIKVAPGEQFDIVLAEGISGEIISVAVTDELPEGVEFTDELASARRCGVRGVLNDGASFDFSVQFGFEEKSISMHFRVETGTASAAFPEGVYMVPFGGSPNTAALLPEQPRRKDEEEDQV